MPRLPPKPEVPPIVAQSLIIAALSVTACSRTPPRIGQPPPPPVRIGAELPPDDYHPPECELQVIDESGQPIAGATVDYRDGGSLQTDAEGRLFGPPGAVLISHPDYASQSVNPCAHERVVLESLTPPQGAPQAPPPPTTGPLTVPPVRIGMHPGDDVDLP